METKIANADPEYTVERRIAALNDSVKGLNKIRIEMRVEINGLKQKIRILEIKLKSALKKKSLVSLKRELDAYQADLMQRIDAVSERQEQLQ